MGLIQNATFQFDSESSYGTGAGSYTYMPIMSDGNPPDFVVPQFEKDFYTGGHARAASIPGTGIYKKKFICYLKGSGTPGTAPELSKLLLCCGLSETDTADTDDYHPTESSYGSASIKYNLDSIEYLFTGARASGFVVTFKGGEPVVFEADIEGLATAPTAQAIAAPSYAQSTVAPIAQAMAITIGAKTHLITEIKATCDLKTAWLPNVNATIGTGVFTPGRRECYIDVTALKDTDNDLEWTAGLLAGLNTPLVQRE